jgi:hypothetical protein
LKVFHCINLAKTAKFLFLKKFEISSQKNKKATNLVRVKIGHFGLGIREIGYENQ